MICHANVTGKHEILPASVECKETEITPGASKDVILRKIPAWGLIGFWSATDWL